MIITSNSKGLKQLPTSNWLSRSKTLKQVTFSKEVPLQCLNDWCKKLKGQNRICIFHSIKLTGSIMPRIIAASVIIKLSNTKVFLGFHFFPFVSQVTVTWSSYFLLECGLCSLHCNFVISGITVWKSKVEVFDVQVQEREDQLHKINFHKCEKKVFSRTCARS